MNASEQLLALLDTVLDRTVELWVLGRETAAQRWWAVAVAIVEEAGGPGNPDGDTARPAAA